MFKAIATTLVLLLNVGAAAAQDITYRAIIAPMWKSKCMAGHGAQSPERADFLLDEKGYAAKSQGPRMDSYERFIAFVAWPDTGVLMRRLEISPAVPWAATPDKTEKPVAGSGATRDMDSRVKRFLSDCKASTKQKAIQLGGMAPDEARQHANETCNGSLAAFQTCLTQKSKDADACAAEANPSAE